MDGIVLAGGFGTRLRQIVPDLPKPMAPVAGRPFLEILLSALGRKGFRRLVLSLGYMAETVVRHFGDSFAGMEILYEIEEKPLGTGGALRRALRHSRSDHAYVLNGDTYLDLEAAEIEAQWHSERVPLIIAAKVADTARYGRLSVAGGRVTGFVEKGTSGPGFINAGCYVLPPDIARHFPDAETFSLERDFLPDAIERSPFHCFVSRGHFIDIGIPEDYARAQTELLQPPATPT